MLDSMSDELQYQHENIRTAYQMLAHLQEIFGVKGNPDFPDQVRSDLIESRDIFQFFFLILIRSRIFQT